MKNSKLSSMTLTLVAFLKGKVNNLDKCLPLYVPYLFKFDEIVDPPLFSIHYCFVSNSSFESDAGHLLDIAMPADSRPAPTSLPIMISLQCSVDATSSYKISKLSRVGFQNILMNFLFSIIVWGTFSVRFQNILMHFLCQSLFGALFHLRFLHNSSFVIFPAARNQNIDLNVNRR